MPKKGIPGEEGSIQAEAEHGTSSDEEELLDAIRQALDDEEEHGYHAQRMSDLIESLGAGRDKVRGAVKKLINAGEMECVMLSRRNITGALVKVPFYRLVNQERE